MARVIVEGVFLLLFLPMGAAPVPPLAVSVAPPTHRLQVAYERSRFAYEEPGVMREEGGLAGLAVGYHWCPVQAETAELRPVLRLEFARRRGTVGYTGQLSDGTEYTISGIEDRLWELRALVGIARRLETDLWLTACVGYGQRHLSDDASFDPAGYERISRYHYLPLHFEFVRALGGNAQLGLALEYDLLIRGKQQSLLSELDRDLPDIENDQRSGSGARGWLWLQVGADGLALKGGPWVRYWSIDVSEPATRSGPFSARVEPANHSLELGGRMGIVVSRR